MFFSWFRNRRRRNLLAEPFPDAWLTTLQGDVGHYELLAEPERAKLRNAVRIMLSEKDWEGCRGLELTDEIRVTIAAQAAILVLGLDDFYFDNVATVLVYPDEFVVKEERAIAAGVTVEEESDRLGEAHYRGPVILSWKEIRANAIAPGYGQNLVFHEFAHQLDMLNGAFDGTPDLPTNELAERWAHLMDKEYRRLQRAGADWPGDVARSVQRRPIQPSFLRSQPSASSMRRAMQREYPPLYELFRDYFRQDPATWPDFESHSV